MLREASSSSQAIGDRIAARKFAEQIMCIVDEELKDKSVHFKKSAWDQLHKIACAHTKCNETRPMTEEESIRFDKVEVPFGIHNGKPVKDVELSYLEWIADQRFVDELRRYLDSDRIQEQRRETE